MTRRARPSRAADGSDDPGSAGLTLSAESAGVTSQTRSSTTSLTQSVPSTSRSPSSLAAQDPSRLGQPLVGPRQTPGDREVGGDEVTRAGPQQLAEELTEGAAGQVRRGRQVRGSGGGCTEPANQSGEALDLGGSGAAQALSQPLRLGGVEAGADRGHHHLAVAGGGQSVAAHRDLVVAEQGHRLSVGVAQGELTTLAAQGGDRRQRGTTAERADQLGQLVGQLALPHRDDQLLGQQRAPVGRAEVPLTPAVQHPVGQQHAGTDQPVVGRIQQGEVDVVAGVVAGTGHQRRQSQVGSDRTGHLRAVGHVEQPLTERANRRRGWRCRRGRPGRFGPPGPSGRPRRGVRGCRLGPAALGGRAGVSLGLRRLGVPPLGLAHRVILPPVAAPITLRSS